jgi:cytoskeletal protein CcmA (bactofilin family)
MKTKLFFAIALVAGLSYADPKMAMNIDCLDDSCKNSTKITTVTDRFDDDYLFIGNELVFKGETQDLVFLGKTLTAEGGARLGFMGAGKTLKFSGPVGNGILAAGGDIVLGNVVTGNNYLACKTLQQAGGATINGNLFAACAKGKLGGTINGDLYCGAGELVINGTVNGNAKVYGGRIVIGPDAKINGNLTYGSRERLSVDECARVSGTVTRDEKHPFSRDKFVPDDAGKVFLFFLGTACLLSFIIIGCLLFLVPACRQLPIVNADRPFWNRALYGLVPFVMYPAAIVLSFVLVVTIPFGFVLLLAWIPVLFFCGIIGTTLAGAYIASKFHWQVKKLQWLFLIGLLAGLILSVIPVINFFWFVLTGALGWGVVLELLGRTKPAVESTVATTATKGGAS